MNKSRQQSMKQPNVILLTEESNVVLLFEFTLISLAVSAVSAVSVPPLSGSLSFLHYFPYLHFFFLILILFCSLFSSSFVFFPGC